MKDIDKGMFNNEMAATTIHDQTYDAHVKRPTRGPPL